MNESPTNQSHPPAPRSIRFLRLLLTVLLGFAILGAISLCIFILAGRNDPDLNSAAGMITDRAALQSVALPDGVTATNIVVRAPITDLGSQIIWYASLLAGVTTFIYLLVLARRFIMRIEAADAASFWDVSSLRRIGWTLIIYNLTSFLNGLAEYLAVKNGAAGAVATYPDQLFVSLVPAVAGLTAFAFAEVLRRGAQLHKDVEGTI